MVEPIALPRKSPSAISAVSRGMAVLEFLASAQAGASVSEISTTLGIEISVVSRLLATLEIDSYVRRLPQAGDRYVLGWRLAALTYRFVDRLDVPEACLPALRALAAEVQELVQLAVVDGDSVRFIAKAEADQRVTLRGLVGSAAHPDTMATGRAWLAWLPEADRLRVLAGSRGDVPVRAHPPLDKVLADLAEIRQRGFALETESNLEDVVAVAAPVFAKEPRMVVAVVTVSAPAYRVKRADLIAMAPALVATAARISAIWPAALLRDHVHHGVPL
jgi:IclR family acetate operon transcriptional repressor